MSSTVRVTIVFAFCYITSIISHGFDSHTLVHLADNTYSEISQLCHRSLHKKVMIATYDFQSGLCARLIRRCGRSTVDQYVRFSIEDVASNNFVVCTLMQEFFCPLKQQWVPAYKLKIGDLLYCKNENKLITYIEYVKQTVEVFIFELRSPHTFFVGRSCLLTHNTTLPIVWDTALSVSFGSLVGSSVGSFLGPTTLVAGAMVGSIIGVCIALFQYDCIPKYSFVANDIPLAMQVQYDQEHVASENNNENISISPMPGGPKKEDENKNKGRANKDLMNEIKNLSKQLQEHEKKLSDYIRDPDKYDNKNFLQRASTPEQRNNIIQGRIKHLESEISNFKRLIDNATEELKIRGLW